MFYTASAGQLGVLPAARQLHAGEYRKVKITRAPTPSPQVATRGTGPRAPSHNLCHTGIQKMSRYQRARTHPSQQAAQRMHAARGTKLCAPGFRVARRQAAPRRHTRMGRNHVRAPHPPNTGCDKRYRAMHPPPPRVCAHARARPSFTLQLAPRASTPLPPASALSHPQVPRPAAKLQRWCLGVSSQTLYVHPTTAPLGAPHFDVPRGLEVGQDVWLSQGWCDCVSDAYTTTCTSAGICRRHLPLASAGASR